MRKSLLITGATGFVGRNLLLDLLRESEYEAIYLPVRSVAKLKSQLAAEGHKALPSHFHPYEADASDWKVPPAPISHVVHIAGLLSGQTWDDYVRANVTGTATLLNAVGNAERIVVLSSQAAAGPTPDGRDSRTEDEAESPVNFYGRSKLEMERLIQGQFASLPIVVLRPPMVIGPRDNATLPLFKMARSPLRVKVGRLPKFYSYIAVRDLVCAITSVLRADGLPTPLPATYFVCSPQVTSDSELIDCAASTLGKTGRTISVPHFAILGAARAINPFRKLREKIPNLTRDRVSEMLPARWVSSAKRFERDFVWKAEMDLSQTLKETAEWYVSSGALLR